MGATVPLQIRQVEVFRAVMSTGTVSAAAQLLGMSQPAATQLLKALEASTRLSLFERTGGRLRPTPEGTALYSEVKRSFRGLEELDHAVAGLRGFNLGRLQVATMQALSGRLFSRAVRDFHAGHPGVRISLQVRTSDEVRDLVLSGRMDFGVVADGSNTSGLRSSTFYRVPAVCAFPAGHRFERLDVVTPQDLVGEPFVAHNPENRTRLMLERVLQAAGLALDIVLETPNSATLCTAALEGVGVALVNPLTALDHLPAGLRIRPFSPAITFHTTMVFPPAQPQSELSRRFVAALRKRLALELDNPAFGSAKA
jgi:DNA-binding transcriptional LysR family regulator